MIKLYRYLITTALFLPGIAAAQGNGFAGDFIICNKNVQDVATDASNRCDFNDLIIVANIAIKLLFQLSLAISVVVLLITGAKYLIAGSSDAKKEAKKSFKKLAIGFALILGAYLIVNTIFTLAGVNPEFQFLE